MDPDLIKLFGLMTAVLVPVAIGGGVYYLVTSLAKRVTRPHDVTQIDDLQELRERVEELERKEGRLQEIEERLDFLERVLPRVRESQSPQGAPRAPREKTPV